MMKRFIASILLLCLITTLLFGCTKNTNNLLAGAGNITALSNVKHITKLSDFDSPYTICYKNSNNTYSLYMFASPVQYLSNDQYVLIDNAIVKSNNKKYKYENKANEIKTYFPLKISDGLLITKNKDSIKINLCGDLSEFEEVEQIEYENMFGDKVSAVIYKSAGFDIIFYPTKSGIKSEVLWNNEKKKEIEFSVSVSDSFVDKTKNEYMVFKNINKEKTAVIYASLSKYGTPEKMETCSNEIEYKGLTDDEKNIICIKPSDSINVEMVNKTGFSFEYYLNKMADSTAYSEYDENTYLSEYFVVGNSKLYGESIHYIRTRLNLFMSTGEDNIKAATYSIKPLSDNTDFSKIALFKVDNQWSSTKLSWLNKSDLGIRLCNGKEINGYEVFDITGYVKQAFQKADVLMESYGFAIKSENNIEDTFLASSDNSLYSPYITLLLDREPAYFQAKININDTQY